MLKKAASSPFTRIAHAATILVGGALLTGCAALSPPKSGRASIVVSAAQTATARGSTIRYPAGLYAPEFENADGIFYRAPSEIVATAMGLRTNAPGGVFIPFDNTASPAGWGWRQAPLTPLISYRITPPIPFRFVQSPSLDRYAPAPAPTR